MTSHTFVDMIGDQVSAASQMRKCGREMRHDGRSLAFTAANFEFPPNIMRPTPESDQSEFEHDDYDIREEDIQSIVGVSMGRAQTRLMSSTASVTDRDSVMRRAEGWRFFDDRGGNDDQNCDKILQHPLRNTDRDIQSDYRLSSPGDLEASLPSPWTATPKIFETSSSISKSGRSTPNTRSRASTGPTSILADLSIKRFLGNFSSALSEQNFLKDFSMPKLPSFLSGAKEDERDQQRGGRPQRSYSLFTPDFSWTSSVVTERSPRTRQASPDLNAVQGQAGLPSGSRSSSSRPLPLRVDTSKDSLIRSNSNDRSRNIKIVTFKTSNLRRATSDQSLQRSATLSSLGDDSRWDHVHGQVNSRMKAIRDSFQDSSLKLPSLPSINFGALRPDFTHRRSASITKNNSANYTIPIINGYEERRLRNPPTQSFAASTGPALSQKPAKKTNPCLNSALNDLTGDVVILGGYRGSILRSAESPHRQLWVPVKVGLNLRKVNLEVGLEPEDEENMESTIFASGMLTHIGPVDISRRLIKRLRKCKNARDGMLRVHDYGYDWRLSPHLLSHKLIEYLKGLQCNQLGVPIHERGATVIAHSLGGLITRHAVNQQPNLFAGVVYAGVPQQCVNILGPFRNGDEVLLSSKVLTAQVNFTLRTSFALLPESGECFFDKYTNEKYDVNFFDPASWKEYAFSPCIAPAFPVLAQPERRGLLPSLTSRKGSGVLNPPNTSLMVASDKVDRTIDDITNPEAHNLSMQMNNSSPQITTTTIPLPAAMAYLSRTLAATLAFKHELAFNSRHAQENTYPPLAIIYGTSVPTVYGARVVGRDGIRRADAYDDLAFASGDGVVLARAAMLPSGYHTVDGGRVRTERGHVGLLGDLEAVGRCLAAVKMARGKGVGLGNVFEARS